MDIATEPSTKSPTGGNTLEEMLGLSHSQAYNIMKPHFLKKHPIHTIHPVFFCLFVL